MREKEKKHKVIKTVSLAFRLAKTAALLYGLVTAGKKLTGRMNAKFAEDNEESKEKRYLCFMEKCTHKPEKGTDRVDLYLLGAKTRLDLTELTDAEEISIRVFGAASALEILVPPKMRAEVIAEGVYTFKNKVPAYEEEGTLPMLRTRLKVVGCSCDVKMVYTA